MTPQDLDALEKLADEATPGEWKPTPGHPSGRFHGIHTDDGPVVRFGGMGKVSTAGHANAAFIAAANPATIKALIAELREARGVLKFANYSRAIIIAAAGGRVEIDRDLMCESPEDWVVEQSQDATTGRIVCRAFLSRSTTQSGCAEELQPDRNGKGEGG